MAPDPGMRLGIYGDLQYLGDEARVSSDLSFARFLVAVAEAAGSITVFGRRRPGSGAVELPRDRIRFVPLQHYDSLRGPVDVLGAWSRSVPAFEAALSTLDAVWLFGPHPLALVFARRARRARTPVFLGIRQHFPDYLTARASGPWGLPVRVAGWGLEEAFARLARHSPTVVAGEDLARRWRSRAKAVLSVPFSLVAAGDLVDVTDVGRPTLRSPRTLLSVGRLDPEKNPLLLVEIIRSLGPDWRLVVAGDGSLSEAVARAATVAGVADRIDLLGHVAHGDTLRARYRQADLFVHVSLTEGVPQVLHEAAAAGLPVVATAVGGVAAALADGDRGLLVPPRDAAAAVAALRRLEGDPGLRRRVAMAAWKAVAADTVEHQAARVLAFFTSQLGPQAAAP